MDTVLFGPVSYTHLDVYKRQNIPLPRVKGGLVPALHVRENGKLAKDRYD